MDKTLTCFDGEVYVQIPRWIWHLTRYVITIQPLEQPVAEQNAWDVLEPMTGTVSAERLDWRTRPLSGVW